MCLVNILVSAMVLVLRGWGILTERVVAHPTTLSPFPQVFHVTGESQASYAELKLPSI